MKTRFSSYDIVCSVTELQKLVGLRVNQVYDIDNRTYLIRLQDKDVKTVLLLESGNRFHTTAFEWPKNVAPSGFSMKLRKHLKNKRLEKFVQRGSDRIVELQFGMNDAAYHVIVELYDRGNIILTDYEMTILNILRPHVEGEEVRFAVREKYPESRGRNQNVLDTLEELTAVMKNGKPGDTLKKVLNPVLGCGPAVIDHVLTKYQLTDVKLAAEVVPEEETQTDTNKKGKKQKHKKADIKQIRVFNFETDLPILMNALQEANQMMQDAQTNKSKGYIIQKRELKPSQSGEEEFFDHNIEYNPYLFAQHQDQLYKEFETFDAAVDEFYSTFESQKIDVKTMQQERDALKKLSNVKKDHEKRLDDLTKTQVFDKHRADLITGNQALVDNAILAIRSAIANQLPWNEIQNLVKAAQGNKDPVASCIRQLKLEKNHMSLYLTDPYVGDEDDENDDNERLAPLTIDIDLGISAYANATRYYDQKRNAAKKQQRTIESSTKALKSAEIKTKQTLKEMRNISTISKARKTFWFEKFYWFISTENFLVIGGRDQQQNELIVKRYMRATDIYVHAEIQGASSVVIRNPTGTDVPPKTLLEAGTMAISYSVAWDAKVVTSAYWVRSNQVSKTAPTGEYLGTGSFMIRGKKNFLPPCHLILGLSFLFKLEESSVARHAGERRVRTFDEDDDGASVIVENEKFDDVSEEQEIELLDSDDEEAKPMVDDKVEIVEQLNTVKLYSDDEEDEDGVQYPDTHIKIEHNTGKVSVQTDPILQRLKSESEEKNGVVYLGDNQPFIIHTGAQAKIKQQKKDRAARKGKKVQVIEKEETEERDERKSNQPKRGQKGKLKKIREKYKDQDEEEKRIRMEILKSAGTAKVSLKKGQKGITTIDAGANDDVEDGKKQIFTKPEPKEQVAQEDGGGGGDDDEVPAGADVDMLDSLTGLPMDEDELLFAVPVIAPYQALQNYKFKVKITPGTGRRGKASKTAMLIFMRDKACSSREKDLLKGVKDEVIARNIPGKVKLSAPQLHKFKK